MDQELVISSEIGLDGQLTMSKRDQRPESIKYNGSADCSVHVQFTKVFNAGKTSLIELEDVFLFISIAQILKYDAPPVRSGYSPWSDPAR